MSLTLLDVLLLLPLILGLIRGLFKGLVHELISLAAIFVGIFAAYHYSDEAELFLSEYITQEGLGLRILAYLLIFGGVMVAAFALSFLLTKMLQVMALGLMNRILGGVFGFGKSLLLMLLLIHLLQPYIHTSEKWTENFENSIVYSYMEELSMKAGEWLTNIPADYLNQEGRSNQE